MPLAEVLGVYSHNGLRSWLEKPVAPHLGRWEVICRCGACFRCSLSPEMKRLWVSIRERVGVPIPVTSGVRCPAHQMQVNPSAPDSLHVTGHALDLGWPKGVDRQVFLNLAEEAVGDGGLGIYPWGIHVDTGKGKKPRRRWGSLNK